jgi:hypothetical protein
MVLVGNAMINSKAFTDLIFMPQVLLPFLSFVWNKLSGNPENTRAEADAELLLLARRVLNDGAWRIQDFLFRNPNIAALTYETIPFNMKGEFPFLRASDFAQLKRLYNRTRYADRSGPEGLEDLRATLQLEINMSRNRQFRAYPHSIRTIFGWAGGQLGLISTLGYFALIFLKATNYLGDGGGYTAAAVASLGFVYLVWAVGLSSIENIVRYGYDVAATTGSNIMAKCQRSAPVPSFKELIPSVLRAYPGATAAFLVLFYACAIFSYQASLGLINTSLPEFLVKIFGGSVEDWAGLAAKLAVPTVIGACAFNSYPMGQAAVALVRNSARFVYGVAPDAIDAHKLTTLALKEELDTVTDQAFSADSKYTLELIRDVTADNASAHDFDSAPADTEEKKEHPFNAFAQDSTKQKNVRYGCAKSLLNYMESLWVGRRIGGDEYAENLRGENSGENVGLIAMNAKL